MDHPSENDISILLRQLQDNVEKSMQSPAPKVENASKDDREETDEERLERLKCLTNDEENVSNGTKNQASEYDISGFELDESQNSPPEDEPSASDSPDEKSSSDIEDVDLAFVDIEEPQQSSALEKEAPCEQEREQEIEPEPDREFLQTETPITHQELPAFSTMEFSEDFVSANQDDSRANELIEESAENISEQVNMDVSKQKTAENQEIFSEEESDIVNDEDLEQDELSDAEKEQAVLEQVQSFMESQGEEDQINSFFDSFRRSEKPELKTADNLSAEKTGTESVSNDTEIAVEGQFLSSDKKADSAENETVFEGINEIPFTNDFAEDSKANSFFASRTEKKKEVADRFDDTDINLALALGSKQELENVIGFEKVRISKNEFFDPYEEDQISQAVFASAGKEYRSFDQNTTIKTRFKREKRNICRRFILTLLITLVFFVMEHFGILGIRIPYVSDFLSVPLYFYGLSFVLFMAVFALSSKQICLAVSDAVRMRLNSYIPLALLSIVNITYNLLLCLAFTGDGFVTYNFVLCFYYLFAIADDYMHVVQESLSFDVISGNQPKLSLEKLSGSDDGNGQTNFKKYFVERIEFVGRYFARLDKKSVAEYQCFPEFLAIVLVGLGFSVLAAYKTGSFAEGFSSTFLYLLLATPVTFMVYNIYPIFYLSKGLYKQDSAVLGESVVDEYADADMIYLDDLEMFGQHGAFVSAIRVMNDMEYSSILYYLKSIFTAIGAPLCNALDDGNKPIPCSENVKITHIYRNGVFTTVDETHTVAIGNSIFAKKLGHNTGMNYDDIQKEESGQMSFMFLIVDGKACAKLYMRYSVTLRFEKFVSEIQENAIKIGIRSLDPCVNENSISRKRGKQQEPITVVRPSVNDLVPVGKRSDSGIVTAKNSHMIFRILAQCLKIRTLHQKERKIRILSCVLGGVIAVFALAFQLEKYLPSIVIVAYQTLWCIIFGILNRRNLK